MHSYWALKNQESIDGLSGMQRGVLTAQRENVKPIKKMVGAPAATLYTTRTARVEVTLYSVLLVVLSASMGFVAALASASMLGFLRT